MKLNKEQKLELLKKNKTLAEFLNTNDLIDSLSSIAQSLQDGSLRSEKNTNVSLTSSKEITDILKQLVKENYNKNRPKDGYTPIKNKDYFDGKDGYTPIKGVDYFDGKDAEISDELIMDMVDMVRDMAAEQIDVATEITKNPEAVRNALELLPEKLSAESVEGITDLIEGQEQLSKRIDLISKRSAGRNVTMFGGGGMSNDRVNKLIEEKLATYVPDDSAAIWGNITGTLSDQTDLQSALDSKVSKSDYTPAHSILVQQSGTGSPEALQVSNNTIIGRKNGGGSEIEDLSPTDARDVLGLGTAATTDEADYTLNSVTENGATTDNDIITGDIATTSMLITTRTDLPFDDTKTGATQGQILFAAQGNRTFEFSSAATSSGDFANGVKLNSYFTNTGGANAFIFQSRGNDMLILQESRADFTDDLYVAQDLFVTGDLTVDSDTLYVDSVNAHVGVGTVSPDHTLHVSGNQDVVKIEHGSCTTIFTDDTINVVSSQTNGATLIDVTDQDGSNGRGIMHLKGNAGSNDVLWVTAGGRIGIMTTTPSVELEVNGSIKATDINFSGLPTSAAGLSSGDVWNDSGTLKII